MATVELTLKDGIDEFRPGDIIEGTVAWAEAEGATAVEARLITVLNSIGARGETTVAERVRVEGTEGSGRAAFRFSAPRDMPSFHAKVVARSWGVEAVVEPSGESSVVWISISPSGKTIMMNPSYDYAEEVSRDP